MNESCANWPMNNARRVNVSWCFEKISSSWAQHNMLRLMLCSAALVMLDADNIIMWIGKLSCVHTTSLQMQADYCKFYFYDWSDVWRTVMSSELKMFGWFFACSILLGELQIILAQFCNIFRNKNPTNAGRKFHILLQW